MGEEGKYENNLQSFILFAPKKVHYCGIVLFLQIKHLMENSVL